MFDPRQDGGPVSRQPSKRIDSTICRISAFSPDGAGQPEDPGKPDDPGRP